MTYFQVCADLVKYFPSFYEIRKLLFIVMFSYNFNISKQAENLIIDSKVLVREMLWVDIYEEVVLTDLIT